MVATPTPDTGSVNFSSTAPKLAPTDQEDEIVQALESYRTEADNARKGGLNPRDQKWEDNLNLYWNRVDFSKKKSWQARETMPEVPSYVDRFAAALKEALVATPEGFYTVTHPSDQEGDIAQAVKRMTDLWLSRAGRNQMGQLLPFSSVFEEQMKLGALMACSSVTTWKDDVPGGRVAIETVDPRFIWMDHTFRNLYRMRRVELDMHDLRSMAAAKDSKGGSIWNLPNMEMLIGSLNQMDQANKEQLSGTGQQISTSRSPVVLDEYIATIVGKDGKVIADKALCVVANGRYLVRGPEANPFWHESDWLTYAPLVTAPLSVYGRSYMEDFGSIAQTFTHLTNMILDAVHVSALNAIAVVPGMLANPNQLADGVTPGKMFVLEEGMRPDDFAKALELGRLSPEAVKVWEMMKNELGEAAGINEIGLGQFAPNGRTSATEILETKQSSSALIRSVAQTVETRYLDNQLDLTWKTGLQHVSKDDKAMRLAVGEEMFGALWGERKELIKQPFTFQARGISALIQRSTMLKSLVGMLQLVSGNELLLKEFLKVVSLDKLVAKMFELSNIDLTKLQATQRDLMIRSITEPVQQAQDRSAGAPDAGPGVQRQMGQMANRMGVAK